MAGNAPVSSNTPVYAQISSGVWNGADAVRFLLAKMGDIAQHIARIGSSAQHLSNAFGKLESLTGRITAVLAAGMGLPPAVRGGLIYGLTNLGGKKGAAAAIAAGGGESSGTGFSGYGKAFEEWKAYQKRKEDYLKTRNTERESSGTGFSGYGKAFEEWKAYQKRKEYYLKSRNLDYGKTFKEWKAYQKQKEDYLKTRNTEREMERIRGMATIHVQKAILAGTFSKLFQGKKPNDQGDIQAAINDLSIGMMQTAGLPTSSPVPKVIQALASKSASAPPSAAPTSSPVPEGAWLSFGSDRINASAQVPPSAWLSFGSDRINASAQATPSAASQRTSEFVGKTIAKGLLSGIRRGGGGIYNFLTAEGQDDQGRSTPSRMQRLRDSLRTGSHSLFASTAVIGAAASVGAPDAWATFVDSLKLVAGYLGHALIPTLLKWSQTLQEFAFSIAEMSPRTKELIGRLAEGAIVFGVVTSGLNLLSTALTTTTGRLGLLSAAAYALFELFKSRVDQSQEGVKNATLAGAMESLTINREESEQAAKNWIERYGSREKALAAAKQSLMGTLNVRGVFANEQPDFLWGVPDYLNTLVDPEHRAQRVRAISNERTIADRYRALISVLEGNAGAVPSKRQANAALRNLQADNDPSIRSARMNVLMAMRSQRVQPQYSSIEEAYRNIQISALSKDPIEQALENMVDQGNRITENTLRNANLSEDLVNLLRSRPELWGSTK